MPLWPTTVNNLQVKMKMKIYILLTNSHEQVKPRLTEKRETLKGES